MHRQKYVDEINGSHVERELYMQRVSIIWAGRKESSLAAIVFSIENEIIKNSTTEKHWYLNVCEPDSPPVGNLADCGQFFFDYYVDAAERIIIFEIKIKYSIPSLLKDLPFVVSPFTVTKKKKKIVGDRNNNHLG